MKIFIILTILAVLAFGCQTKQDEVRSDEILENLPESAPKDTLPKTLEIQSRSDIDGTSKPEKQQTQESEDSEFLSQKKLWDSYNLVKAKIEEAENNDNLEDMSKFSHEAAIFANALQRSDIEAWQYNNAAYYLIKEFKERTDYQAKMDQLNSLKLNKEISDYRASIQKDFRQQSQLLSKAEGYLKKAKAIDSKLEKTDRTIIISNNLSFVDFVMGFLEMNDEIKEN